MALKPTNPKKTPITEGEFRQKLKNKDGDFQNRIFDFAITRDSLQKAVGLAEDGNIHFNFDLNFADSEFQTIDVGSRIPYNDDAPKVIFSGKVNFNNATFSREANFFKATFKGEVSFIATTFSDKVNFFRAIFSGKTHFAGTRFSRVVRFHYAIFSGEADFWHVRFSGEVRFANATFSGEVRFANATFSDRANFGKARFLGEVHFNRATFSDRANFDGVTFSDRANFHEATFLEEVNFNRATFSDIANFGKAIFSDKVSFVNATFLDRADFVWVTFSITAKFEEAIFSGKANFNNATFKEEARFNKATFSGKVNFAYATFSDITIFNKAIFSDIADFSYATFLGKAKFEWATFSGEANFRQAKFSGEVHFSEATFSIEAGFLWATFSDRANFYGATFSDRANFHQAIFSGKAEFIGTTFSRKVGFVKARFSDIANFGYIIFLQEADFTNTIFLNAVQFRRATFSPDHHTYFCNLNLKQKDDPDKRNEKETYPAPRLQFRDTIFPKLVLFSNCNLSQTTFESCTIAGIKFRSCEFVKTGFFIFKRNAFENRTGQKSFWENIWVALRLEGRLLKKDFSKKRDEIKKDVKELEKNNEKLHSIELETEEKRKDREDLCCQMKTALESSKEWKQAGDFYIGELEARRSKNWWEYIKLTSFKYLLGYAERISVLFISITILFFAAALILGDSLYGFSFDGWFINYNWSCFEFDFEKAAKSTIFPLTLRLELKADDAIKFWETAFLIASWVLWITLAVAVRRRFRF